MTRRRLTILAIVVAAALAVVAGALIWSPGSDPVDDALDTAKDERHFDTGLEAGETFARIAGILNGAIADCDETSRRSQCAGLGAASGYSMVLAAHVLRCTAPGRFEARTNFVAFLEQVRALDPDDVLPEPAPLPDCE